MLKNILNLFLLISVLLLLNACQSHEYYQERAVNRAREYLIKNAKDLDVEQSQFVRYNKPILMIEPIIGYGHDLKSSWIYTSSVQVCITWLIPGNKYAYVVYGTSSGSLREWQPLRLIRKRYIQPEYSKDAAIKKARIYALNNMLFLKYPSRLKIRFDDPKCIRTSYEMPGIDLMNSDFGKSLKLDKSKAEKFLKDNQQVTIYWESDEGKKQKVGVIGYCGNSYSTWNPVSCELFTEEEFKAHKLAGDSGIESIK